MYTMYIYIWIYIHIYEYIYIYIYIYMNGMCMWTTLVGVTVHGGAAAHTHTQLGMQVF